MSQGLINILSLKSVKDLQKSCYAKQMKNQFQQMKQMFMGNCESFNMKKDSLNHKSNERMLNIFKSSKKFNYSALRQKNMSSQSNTIKSKKQSSTSLSIRNLELLKVEGNENTIKGIKQVYLRRLSKSTKILKVQESKEIPKQTATTMVLLKRLEESIHLRKYSRKISKIKTEGSLKDDDEDPQKSIEKKGKNEVNYLRRNFLFDKISRNRSEQKKSEEILKDLREIMAKPKHQRTLYTLEPWRSSEIEQNQDF